VHQKCHKAPLRNNKDATVTMASTNENYEIGYARRRFSKIMTPAFFNIFLPLWAANASFENAIILDVVRRSYKALYKATISELTPENGLKK
jgi:hypothetical protein